VLQEQGPGMDELRKTVLRLHPDLKDKSMFWKRRTSVLKVGGRLRVW
jgi:translocation protein SEC63